MLVYFLIGMGIGLLATLVVWIGKITVKAIAERIKKKHAKKLALKRARELMVDIINMSNEGKIEQDAISISELEDLFHEEGCVEYTINSEGKVNADDIEILQAEEIEPKLKSMFDTHGGELLLTA